jgi:hypothetical protein
VRESKREREQERESKRERPLHASQAGKGLSSNAEGAPAKGIASFFVKLPSPGATPKTMGAGGQKVTPDTKKRVRPAEISDEEGVVVISD